MKIALFVFVSVLLGICSSQLAPVAVMVEGNELAFPRAASAACGSTAPHYALFPAAELNWTAMRVTPIEMFIHSPSGGMLMRCGDLFALFVLNILDANSSVVAQLIHKKDFEIVNGVQFHPDVLSHTFSPCEIYGNLEGKSLNFTTAQVQLSVRLAGIAPVVQPGDFVIAGRFIKVIIPSLGSIDDAVVIPHGGTIDVIHENSFCDEVLQRCSVEAAPSSVFEVSEYNVYLPINAKMPSCKVSPGLRTKYTILTRRSGVNCDNYTCDVTLSVTIETGALPTRPPDTTTSNAVKASIVAAFLAVLFSV